jgi:hypothetical protein
MAELRAQERLRPDSPSCCALCKAELGSEPLHACAGCGTRYHAACALELGGCSTLGCAEFGRDVAPSIPDNPELEALRERVRARQLRPPRPDLDDDADVHPAEPKLEELILVYFVFGFWLLIVLAAVVSQLVRALSQGGGS